MQTMDQVMAKMELCRLDAKKRREAQERQAKKAATEPAARRQANQLPYWPESCIGVPNMILRSALFGVAGSGTKRKYLKGVVKASVTGVDIIYTGEELGQSDLDVWEHCVSLARAVGEVKKVYFEISGFMRGIDRSAGGKANAEWLKTTLRRLQATAVEIKVNKKKTFSGSLLPSFSYDDEIGRYYVEVNENILRLYAHGYTQIDRERRRTFRGDALAQWIHAYFCANNNVYGWSIIKIKQLCGVADQNSSRFLSKLKKSLDLVCRVTGWSWRIERDILHIAKPKTISAQ